MGKKKTTRKAASKQPAKEVITQPQLAALLRLKKENKRLKENATAEQAEAARKKELKDKLWHAKHEVHQLKAELGGSLDENLENFAYWAWRYAAPLLKTMSETLERFDRGSKGDIEDHCEREEIAHGISYALAKLSDDIEEKATVATQLT